MTSPPPFLLPFMSFLLFVFPCSPTYIPLIAFLPPFLPSFLPPFLPSSLPPFLPPSLPPSLPVPECLADHVLVGDAVVGQGLAPHGVECVVQGLGPKFICLKDKQRRRVKETSEGDDGLTLVFLWVRTRVSGCKHTLTAALWAELRVTSKHWTALTGVINTTQSPTCCLLWQGQRRQGLSLSTPRYLIDFRETFNFSVRTNLNNKGPNKQGNKMLSQLQFNIYNYITICRCPLRRRTERDGGSDVCVGGGGSDSNVPRNKHLIVSASISGCFPQEGCW